MRVVRAKHAGVCYGVERALDMAVVAMMDEDDTHTLGPLIHNPTVVKQLEEQGVKVAKSVDDIESGIVVIRSHGVEPHVMQQLKDKGLTVIDATCPHVAKAQRSAGELRDAGGTVIVIGRAEHPEVKGLCGHAGERAVVVADVDELPDDLIEPVGIVVQTTESKEKLEAVVEAVRARGIEPVVKNTICFATRQRQRFRGRPCRRSGRHRGDRREELVEYHASLRHLQGPLRALLFHRARRRNRPGVVRRLRNGGRDRRRIDPRRPDLRGGRLFGNLVKVEAGASVPVSS